MPLPWNPSRKHGHVDGGKPTRIYKCWNAMKQRCLRPNHPAYKYYGGRGITFDPSWVSFERFHEDMGPCPEGMTLDRINNDGPYSKENCRWATRLQQGENTRKRRLLTFNGETKSIAQWARFLGWDPNLIYSRLQHCGWSVEEALTTKPHSRLYQTVNGQKVRRTALKAVSGKKK